MGWFLVLEVAFLGSYSGALHHALALQLVRQRHLTSRVPMIYLAVGAVVAQALSGGLLGLGIPFWVYWSTRPGSPEAPLPPETSLEE